MKTLDEILECLVGLDVKIITASSKNIEGKVHSTYKNYILADIGKRELKPVNYGEFTLKYTDIPIIPQDVNTFNGLNAYEKILNELIYITNKEKGQYSVTLSNLIKELSICRHELNNLQLHEQVFNMKDMKTLEEIIALLQGIEVKTNNGSREGVIYSQNIAKEQITMIMNDTSAYKTIYFGDFTLKYSGETINLDDVKEYNGLRLYKKILYDAIRKVELEGGQEIALTSLKQEYFNCSHELNLLQLKQQEELEQCRRENHKNFKNMINTLNGVIGNKENHETFAFKHLEKEYEKKEINYCILQKNIDEYKEVKNRLIGEMVRSQHNGGIIFEIAKITDNEVISSAGISYCCDEIYLPRYKILLKDYLTQIREAIFKDTPTSTIEKSTKDKLSDESLFIFNI